MSRLARETALETAVYTQRQHIAMGVPSGNVVILLK
jgi:hypothetical protein